MRYVEWLKHAECRHCKQIGHIEISCPMKSKFYSHANQATRDPVDNAQVETEVEINVQQATLEGDPSAYLASEKMP